MPMHLPDWLNVVLLGIIEGITEFIPVSSTGHLLIAEKWLPRQSDLFNIVIQCGAVLAVLPLFPERCRQVLRVREPAVRDYYLKIFAAFFVTGAIGFVLDKKGFKLPEELAPVAWALIAGGVLFLVAERMLVGRTVTNRISWTAAIVVGLAQVLAAVFPGTSRSGATIVALLFLGVDRPLATEFSFLVGIPTMLAAGGLKIFKAVRHSGEPTESWGLVALGTIVAAVVSFFVVRWLLRYVQTHTFKGFGWYRIALGALVLAGIYSGFFGS